MDLFSGQRIKYSSAIPLKDYMDLFDKAALQIESRQEVSDDVTSADDDVLKHGQDDVRHAFHPVVTGQCQAGVTRSYLGLWDRHFTKGGRTCTRAMRGGGK